MIFLRHMEMNKTLTLLRVEYVGNGVFFFIWDHFGRGEGITAKSDR